MYAQQKTKGHALASYLTPLSVWALSFGCAVGWGAFVMPGTTFLPIAGPLGTAIGIGIGAVIMLIIGMNYHFLMNKYTDSGGPLTYTVKTFGYDHGFFCAWFLVLVYVTIVWANATALSLIGRHLLGSFFQFGFHYRILGYDVYLGEALLAIAAFLLAGFICIRGKRLSAQIQTVLAAILFAGIALAFCAAWAKHDGGLSSLAPAFAPDGKSTPDQILHIVALTPWAFIGFESIAHSSEEFRFSTKKALPLMATAITTSALAYIMLAELAAMFLPEGFASWTEYVGGLGDLNGLQKLPTFFATHSALGQAGLFLLGITLFAGVATGLLGHYIAASRVLFAMARDDILPQWFGELNEAGAPKNALLFLMAFSLAIPFFGRTAIGWIVDITTIGATIAYAYTSAGAYATARLEGNRKIKAAGLAGLLLSLGFFFYFMMIAEGAIATESYLILACWSILGLIFFHHVFRRDKSRRFGKSTVVWITLLLMIFLTSIMWVRQATSEMMQTLVSDINGYYAEHNPESSPEAIAEAQHYLDEKMAAANRTVTRNDFIQMSLIIIALFIMFNIYTTISSRERQASKAKSFFLTNMSHDMRTPMNAIIGYVGLARKEKGTPPAVAGYLAKLESSSHHLLSLINDVLEMSRIENGRLELHPVQTDLKELLSEATEMFSLQMKSKQIDFSVDVSQTTDSLVLCDRNLLNRVVLNLLSNAYKFTPQGGRVSVSLCQTGNACGMGAFDLHVRDNGIGMTEEFATKVFEAFERERTSTVSGIQGTGLGLAITRNIVSLMGGTIEVITAPGAGTEFIVHLRLELAGNANASADSGKEKGKDEEAMSLDFSKYRLLLVEDNEINREIATLVLEEPGFRLETATNGQEAVEKIASSQPGYYDAVLMDIQMPVMNGYEATRTIRSLDNAALAGIPIIALTANAFAEDIRAAEEAGMNGHVAKPLDIALLMKTLADILR